MTREDMFISSFNNKQTLYAFKCILYIKLYFERDRKVAKDVAVIVSSNHPEPSKMPWSKNLERFEVVSY